MTDTRRDRQLGVVTPNKQRFEAPRATDASVCPLCGAGPFVVLAQHTRKHGIDRFQLRDMLGVHYSDSICDPTYSAGRSAHTKQLISEGVLKGGQPSGPRNISRRTSVERRDRMKEIRALQTPETIAKIARTLRANAAVRRAPRDTEIIQRLATTTDSTRAIAAAMGVGKTTVKRVARENGIDLVARAATGKSAA